MILPLLPSYWGLFFALGCVISVFNGIQHSPVIGCFASSCDFGVIAGENEHISFYSTILGATQHVVVVDYRLGSSPNQITNTQENDKVYDSSSDSERETFVYTKFNKNSSEDKDPD